MNILNEVVKGASRQFGREFGRAGANAILKGKNHYTVQGKEDYSGRIKSSDSSLVKAIKEVNKIKFVTTDKANVSRLIDLTDIVLNNLSFDGIDTLNQISIVSILIEQYNDKFEHGSVLISDDYSDKSLDYLKEKRQEFVDLLNKFNSEVKFFVNTNYESAERNKKSRTTAIWLSCPFLIVGVLGFHKFYLKQYGFGILFILLSATGLSGIFSLVNFLQLLTMTAEKFDAKYNPNYQYYKQFVSE